MLQSLRHRGPDASGIWSDPTRGVTLVHTRLAILDLSPQGHQPMLSVSGRYVLSYNGEVYNFAELRRKLEAKGWSFRGHSDTEVLLALIEEKGLGEALSQASGMFALALYDTHTKSLSLARDRIGEKPLYYAIWNQTLVFGSELKVLLQYPGFPKDLDAEAMGFYAKYGYIPAPRAIFACVRKVQPGTWVTWDLNQPFDFKFGEVYWELRSSVHGRCATEMTEAEALESVRQKLEETVQRQIRSDVPLGCFLSGGVDSSLIAALAQKQISRPLNTFSIGFHEKDYNEAPFAREVAARLGCAHQEWIVTSADVQNVIPDVASIYDEPFSDSSQLPTTLLARFTRRHVTVSLSGDGGDEVFAGYNRYFWCARMWSQLQRIPVPLRRGIQRVLGRISPESWSALYQTLRWILPRVSNPSHKIQKLIGILDSRSDAELYDRLLALWYEPKRLLPRLSADVSLLESRGQMTLLDYMMDLDTRTYLPDDIMVKVDRATMSVGLEARAPFLDHGLVELAWSLPASLKLKDGRGKYLLRTLLKEYLPEELIVRPKTGFGVPLEHWLRTDLRDWARELLRPEALARHGWFNASAVESALEEHLRGWKNNQYQLWNVLVFQSWYDRWIRGNSM